MQAASRMDCSHYEGVMNKQSVIEKLYFMLGRLVNEGLCVVKRGDCRLRLCVADCWCVWLEAMMGYQESQCVD